MSEFTVNIGPRLVRQAGQAAQVLSAIVPDPPRAISALDSGTILKGVVQGRDPDGLTIIATDKGTIRVPVNPSPAAGTLVTLEVRVAGDRLQVLILAAEAPVSQASRKPGPGENNIVDSGAGATGTTHNDRGTQESAGPANRPAGPAMALPVLTKLGTVVEAVIIRMGPEALRLALTSALPGTTDPNVLAPPASHRSPPGEHTHLRPADTQNNPAVGRGAGPPGSISVLQPELRARIEALFHLPTAAPVAAHHVREPSNANPPTATVAPTGQLAQAGQERSILALLAAALNSVGAGADGSEAESKRQLPWHGLPNGAEIKVRVSLPHLASGTANAGLGPVAMENSISGRIVGHAPNGATIVATPFGAIVLKPDLALPMGAEVSLSLESNHIAPMALAAPLPAATNAQQALLLASRGWPTLADVVAILRAQSQPGAVPDAGVRLPQIGARLAADMLRAMRAMRRADIEELLGPAASQRHGASPARDEAIARLRHEFSQLSQFAGEKGEADWRCCLVPFMDDGIVRQINLFYRRFQGNSKNSKSEDDNGTRFVVEIDYSRLGAFQLDGLVRQRRFDLMIRSRIAVNETMRSDIRALFQQALEIGSYTGEIGFQTVRDFPVAPLDDIARRATGVSA